MQIPFTIKNETVYLCCDENNYTLAKIRERSRDGVTTNELENFKWFASIGAALNKLIELKVKAADTKSLLELKEIIEQSRKEVLAVWKATA